MKIVDSIYGEFEIEQIFEELIMTREIQRLKEIHQGGASYLINPKWNVSRYEHSIGTMLFIRIMGGTIEEQIAGLLHDISHTAFSHVIDFALKNNDEDYHEKIYSEVIESSIIPKLLSMHGYNSRDILFNESKWSILEKSAPKLCADRIDYTLRDMFHYGFISKDEINIFLNCLSVIEGEVVITSLKASEWFVDVYYKEVIGHFMNPLNIYANDRLAKALRISLELSEITLDDLLKEDKYVYSLLEKSNSEEVLNLIKSINCGVNLIENNEEYDIFYKSKVRIVDPTIFIDGVVCKSSQISDVVKEMNERALKKSCEGIYLKIL